MRAVVQRVNFSKVVVEGEAVGEIQQGLLVLLGITHEDGEADMDYLIRKITQLRIFIDHEGKMNQSVVDIDGAIQVVSQFTLYADTKKGNRPSYMRAAPPNVAEPLYHSFLEKLSKNFQGPIATGTFGAYMQVSLLNDGPVTILLDSKQPEY